MPGRAYAAHYDLLTHKGGKIQKKTAWTFRQPQVLTKFSGWLKQYFVPPDTIYFVNIYILLL